MAEFIGIYGFDITRPINAAGITIEPVFTNAGEVSTRAEDPRQFILTAVGQIDAGPAAELAFDLAAALTFCQQRWVIVTGPFQPTRSAMTLDQVKGELPSKRDFEARWQSGGALIMRDAFAPDSRQNFLDLCLRRVRDPGFNDRTGYRDAFFRCVQVLRMDPAYVDVTYYLDFSAIEILVRAKSGDYDSGFAQLACPFLKNFGFDVVENKPARRANSMQTYAHLRNALFHQGKFEKRIKENGREVVLKLTDYDDKWRRLVPDVLLKVLGFDDGHINWKRWLDRMSFY